MGLTELTDAVEEENAALGDSIDIELDGETRRNLAFLSAVFEPTDHDELVRRAVSGYLEAMIDSPHIDFQLRQNYDVSYMEYEEGMTMDEMGDFASGFQGLF